MRAPAWGFSSARVRVRRVTAVTARARDRVTAVTRDARRAQRAEGERRWAREDGGGRAKRRQPERERSASAKARHLCCGALERRVEHVARGLDEADVELLAH